MRERRAGLITVGTPSPACMFCGGRLQEQTHLRVLKVRGLKESISHSICSGCMTGAGDTAKYEDPDWVAKELGL
jgi:hypothetical protein